MLNDYDVVHLHYPFYFGSEIIYFISKLRKIKYVVHYHMDIVGKGTTRWVFALHRKIIMPFILKGASKIIVTSKDYLKSSVLKSIPSIKNKIVIVPIGVDTAKFNIRKKSKALLKKHSINKNEKIILFVGGLDKPHYFKGVDILLKAFAKVSSENTKLLIVGDGDSKDTYMQMAKDIGISQRIIFAGRVSDKDLPDYFSICDFLVLPSTDKSEAFGMVLIEAMASGKTVIASNLPGVRSVVSDSINGLLVKPKDVNDLNKKIVYLLTNVKISDQFGKLGRQKVISDYSLLTVNNRLHKILSEVIEN
jgi:glycosyltransferase involved in cell wall biosynthesis